MITENDRHDKFKLLDSTFPFKVFFVLCSLFMVLYYMGISHPNIYCFLYTEHIYLKDVLTSYSFHMQLLTTILKVWNYSLAI